MLGERACDVCGRAEWELTPAADDGPALAIDADGLWLCRDCRARLATAPVGGAGEDEMPDEIRALVGQQAGWITMTLHLPYEPPYRDLIDHADRMQRSLRSPWTFVAQWLDGTTLWRAPDGSAVAIVSPDGSLRIAPR